MKIHTLSSLIKVERSKIPMPTKIVISCTDHSVTKKKIKAILKNYSKIDIIDVNSININKIKKLTSQVVGEKYTRAYSLSRSQYKKKFILSFKHSADRNLFLGEIGVD